jgi:hypothetical protein
MSAQMSSEGAHEDAQVQARFASALRGRDAQVPEGLAAASAHRFAVYRNTIAVRHLEVLDANFPALPQAVGEEFFAAIAQAFFEAHPPRLPILAFYGDELPAFLRSFPPVAEIAYLPDLAAVEVGRTRAAYAADLDPLSGDALATVDPATLGELRVVLHPTVSIVASRHPIVTIWAMNSGAMPVAPIEDWRAESAVIARPQREVEVHLLPPGGDAFLNALAQGDTLGEAAAEAAAAPDFDLAFNLAFLFNRGLVARLTLPSHEG